MTVALAPVVCPLDLTVAVPDHQLDLDTPVFAQMITEARSLKGLKARKVNGRFTTLRLPVLTV